MHFIAHDGSGETPAASATKPIPALVNATVASVPIAVIHRIPYSGIEPTTRVTDQNAMISPARVMAANAASKLRLFANTRIAGASSSSWSGAHTSGHNELLGRNMPPPRNRNAGRNIPATLSAQENNA